MLYRNARQLAVVCLLLAATFSASARIGLVTNSAREAVGIRFDRHGTVLVQEQHDVTVRAGNNIIEFSWPNMQIALDTVQLLPLEDVDSIRTLSVAMPASDPDTLVLEIESDGANEIPFGITYLASGLSWQAAYKAVADAEEQFLSLEAHVTIRNATVEDYDNAQIQLPVGIPFRQSIRSGEGKKTTFLAAEQVPITKTYVSDPWEFQEAVAMHYVFRNDEEHGVGPGMLLPGKVRLFKQDATGSVAFLGEDMVPFVPDGDEVKLTLGPARDIEIERTIMERSRKNVRQNKKGQVVAYDTDEVSRITIHNRKATDVALTVRAHLRGYWRMTESSDDFERSDASTIEFHVTVPARSDREITFEVEGLNLQHGFAIDG